MLLDESQLRWLFSYRALREAIRTQRMSMVSEKEAPPGYEYRVFVKDRNFGKEGMYLRSLADPWHKQIPLKQARSIREKWEAAQKKQ